MFWAQLQKYCECHDAVRDAREEYFRISKKLWISNALIARLSEKSDLIYEFIVSAVPLLG